MPRDLPTTFPQFREFVRLYIRDREPYNTLLDGKETGDQLVELCIALAIDEFNTTPPLIGTYTFQSFPSSWLLLYGTVVEILTSAGILQSRNQLNYSDGGITVSVSDKAPLYQSWINRMSGMYEMRKKAIKTQLNLDQAWGGVQSEYWTVAYGGGLYYNFATFDGFSLAQIEGF